MSEANRGSLIDRATQAVVFAMTHNTWTIEDLSDHLGITSKRGRMYLIALSTYLPIIEVKPARYGYNGKRCTGRLPALYKIDRDWVGRLCSF